VELAVDSRPVDLDRVPAPLGLDRPDLVEAVRLSRLEVPAAFEFDDLLVGQENPRPMPVEYRVALDEPEDERLAVAGELAKPPPRPLVDVAAPRRNS